MADQNTTPEIDRPQPSRRKRSAKTNLTSIFLLLILLVIALYGGYQLFGKQYLEKLRSVPASQNEDDASSLSAQQQPPLVEQPASTAESGVGEPEPAVTPPVIEPIAEQEAPAAGTSLQSPVTEVVAGIDSTEQCDALAARISDFYNHLDQQPYLDRFTIPEPSEKYFSALIQKIIDNPPLVSSETDDLFNILKNTAHFFRVVGKDNILVMKAILDQEKDRFEQVLADYYSLSSQPECLESRFAIRLNEENLYDYAGFFLTTMGGRLYLFRRDSMSRLVVSYYSLRIVDQANDQARNKHGIDISPAVKTLITEFENSRYPFKLKDTYLITLDALEEKYP